MLGATIGLNVYLFIHVPKGFFPQQDNGRLNGTIMADQDTSFQAMQGNLPRMVNIIRQAIRRSLPSADLPEAAAATGTPSTRRACISS